MLSYYPYTRRNHSHSRQRHLYRKQDKIGKRKAADMNNVSGEPYIDTEDETTHEIDYSQSVELPRPRSNSIESTASSFLQSYPPSNQDNQPRFAQPSKAQSKFDHNIGNPDLYIQRCGSETELQRRRQTLFGGRNFNNDKTKRRISTPGNLKKSQSEGHCNCGKYHSHTYVTMRPKLATLCSVTSVDLDSLRKSPDICVAGNTVQMAICDTFWHANLVFSDYKHGNRTVDFSSLWPSTSKIRDLLTDGVKDTGLRSALWELCCLSILSGPLTVLQGLLDLQILPSLKNRKSTKEQFLQDIKWAQGADHQTENDASLLHMACLLRNTDAVQLLLQHGAAHKARDRAGYTAGEVCFCPRMRKQLPAKLSSKSRAVVKSVHHDKDTIFRLASNPKSFYELQKKIQMFEFGANVESNEEGDFLIHTAARAGVCQLPAILSLVRIQQVDIDMCNAQGMTPLMLVAACGDVILCDVFMCLFGANPNKINERTGETALHYALKTNHVHVVNCLLKRGADVNVEDNNQCRPDDMPPSNTSVDDCRQLVQAQRDQRCCDLSHMVQEDTVYPIDLRPSDLPVVNTDGSTLVMLAAENDRVHNLETLLGISTSTINAQHWKTGLTALGKAASNGHSVSCQVLLRFGARASIGDMDGYLPLHRAVLNNHEDVIDIFLKFFPTAFVGLSRAIRYARKISIQENLKNAWQKRQAGIVGPELSLCSKQGNAERLYCVLEEGDLINTKSNLNNMPPLFIAVENSHLDVIHLLKEKGANLRSRDFQTGNTVLHVIAMSGHLETARYLLDFCRPRPTKGTVHISGDELDINAINNDKQTALQIAAEKGYIKLTSLLIECGATTSLLNSKGALFTCPEFEGVRIQIETQRAEHTKRLMALVSDSKHLAKLQSAKNKRKVLAELSEIWLPRFDHNIRDKNGDTPLMVACYRGNLEMVKFLLKSAIYANQVQCDDELDDKSDDSGITVVPPWTSKAGSVFSVPDELMKSIEENEVMDETMGFGASQDLGTSMNPSSMQNTVRVNRAANNAGGAAAGGASVAMSVAGGATGGFHGNRTPVGKWIQDVERPKGLYIYHDGIVSHVCAVNLFDGCTPLHRAIQGGDNSAMTTALLEADPAAINMQDAAGHTAVHLACKLARRRVLTHLLGLEGVDISLPTLTGDLPEEMTTNKTFIKMVQKARRGHPVRCRPSMPDDRSSDGFTRSFSNHGSTGQQTNISFGHIERLYQSLKVGKPKVKTEDKTGTLKYAHKNWSVKNM